MPKHAVTAAGEALPAGNILGRLKGMLESGDVKGALSLLNANPIDAPAEERDPIVEAIAAYRLGWKEFYTAPDEMAEKLDHLWRVPHDVLANWQGGCLTWAGAIGALQIAIEEEDTGESPVVAPMMRAALAFFESRASSESGTVSMTLAADPEHPWTKARRLANELSATLDECDGGNSFAYVLPATCKTTLRYSVLFGMRDYDGGSIDLKAVSELAERHRVALAAWRDVPGVDQCSGRDASIEAEMVESRRALLELRPTTINGIHAKAESMLSFCSIFEWDEIERGDLVRAFTASQEIKE